MKKLIVLIIMVASDFIYAHSPAAASFYLFQQDNVWQMRTEFAWSLRNALIESFPYLNEGVNESEDDYMDCVKDYLDINLKIKLDNSRFDYQSITQIPGSHGHSFSFVVKLIGPSKGHELIIENRCLTEIYRKQKNEVVLKFKGVKQKQIFTKDEEKFAFILEG